MDAYREVFVAGPAAPLLSRPKPLRRSGFELDLVVSKVERIAEEVVALTLRDTENSVLPAWRPGSHLDVFLPSGKQRQYSLCGDPAETTRYRIAVRRIVDGGGGSLEVHGSLKVGDEVRVRGPRNAFAFVEAPSYHFIAGGIGITPILPMVKAAAAAGAQWKMVYLGRSRGTMPFLDELEALGDNVQVRTDEEHGVPDLEQLLAAAEPGAAMYVCGPIPVLEAAQRFAFRVNPTGSLHIERFSALPVVDGREFDLTLARTGRTIRVRADETTLAAIRREIPGVVYSCQQGFCGTCKVSVLRGRVEHRDNRLPDSERANQMLTCVSRACDDSLVVDL
ncbi:oxidoreductase [Skermania sp. ID1734]|uniref:PDR/VanB family oxidoreductase n=1 Tax=Skermania sp. ID1734 TaxID=2597516 RepID=UPI001180EB2E|nr:PDR/VanB family oxidoreductase [Skermania sp. ID1734]TSE01281.1 oxidoreductase [Skermania sp. ID1734]